MGFRAISSRIASLRVKVKGGITTFVSAYAPHDGHDFELRHDFFSLLFESTGTVGKHTSCTVLGDFNAQLGNVGKGEDHIIGPFVFGKTVKNQAVTKTENYLRNTA